MPFIVHPDIEAYAEQHTSPEDEVLYRLNRWTHLNMPQPRMIAGAYQGQFLSMLCSMIAPVRALEIGSYVGYSTICIARSLAPQGHLHAIEINDELEAPILRHLQEAGVSDRVSLHIGDAGALLPSMPHDLDFVFLDADKRHSSSHFNLVLPLVRKGGWILVDNVLWSGKVADPDCHDADTLAFRQLNDQLRDDPRIDQILLPLRDGLMLCRKR